MFWFFGYEFYRIIASWGIEPALSALEGKVLTTRPPGKSPELLKMDIHSYPFLYFKSLMSSPNPNSLQ